MTQRLAARVSFLLWLAVGFGASAGGPAAPAKGLNTSVTFDVAVPLETAPNAEVWISGNDEALGEWNGAGLKLSRTPDGRYTGTVSLPAEHLRSSSR